MKLHGVATAQLNWIGVAVDGNSNDQKVPHVAYPCGPTTRMTFTVMKWDWKTSKWNCACCLPVWSNGVELIRSQRKTLKMDILHPADYNFFFFGWHVAAGGGRTWKTERHSAKANGCKCSVWANKLGNMIRQLCPGLASRYRVLIA